MKNPKTPIWQAKTVLFVVVKAYLTSTTPALVSAPLMDEFSFILRVPPACKLL